MRKSLKLSAIVLLTTAMTAFPAYALSLNLGADGTLVDLGNDSNSDGTVSLDTGDLLGDDSGSSGTDADATLDVNLGSSGDGGSLDDVIDNDGDGGLVNLGGDTDLIDLDSDGDSLIDLGGDGDLLDLGDGAGGLIDLADIDLGDGDLLDLGNDGDLLDLGSGPLLDLSGNTETEALIEADLGGGELLDLGETGSILDLGAGGELLDFGGSGDLLDLGGGELLDLGLSEDVALDLGNTRIDVDLDADGGDDPLATVSISTDQDGVAGTGVLPDTSGTATVAGGNAASVSLATNDDAPGSDGSGGGSNGNSGSGSDSGNGYGGFGGDGNGSAGGNGAGRGFGGSSGGNGSDGAFFAAANSNNAACMTLTAAQLDELIQRHTYNRATFNSWASARSLKIVEVDFCDDAAVDVAAAADGSSNVARLQAFLAAQAKVKAGLESKGHSAGDVIAADHSGNVLIVYVI